MSDVLTTQSSTGFSQTIWSKAIQWPYRSENHFAAIANKKSTTESGTRGAAVTFTYVNDLALATTPIDEVVGPDSVTFTTSTKTITLAEYANTMRSTALARTTGFVDLEPVLANLVGQNAGASIDTIAANVLVASTNIQRAAGRSTTGAITAADVLTTKELEIAWTEMDALNVPKINGKYVAYAHPYQIFDLRRETGAGGFREPRENGSMGSDNLINNTVGEWAGFTIVSANRTPMTADVGASSTVDVYKAVLVGADGFAMGYSDHPEAPGAGPQVRFGLPVDALMRNKPISWYALLGFKILRDASVRILYTASSRGANS